LRLFFKQLGKPTMNASFLLVESSIWIEAALPNLFVDDAAKNMQISGPHFDKVDFITNSKS